MYVCIDPLDICTVCMLDTLLLAIVCMYVCMYVFLLHMIFKLTMCMYVSMNEYLESSEVHAAAEGVRR
jgi:hypothetical protein